MRDFEEKLEVLRNKNKLRGIECYIDNDMMKEERSIQATLRRRAKEEAEKAEGSRFWHSTQEELEEIPVPEGVKSIRTRVIEFSGKFEPVRWSCRAPLPSGKLCPRHDRHKCPFHGPIVPRDASESNPKIEKTLIMFDYTHTFNLEHLQSQIKLFHKSTVFTRVKK
ncbi:hypothetical protein C0J52_26229 [Blattella germanica]|nr:hypothetical protein C0J52_26229 [Blattella germanica]